MLHVTSVQNPRVKAAAKLRSRRARNDQRRYLIDGSRELSMALDANVEFEEVFVCETLVDKLVVQELVERCQRTQAQLFTVTKPVWQKLTYGDRDDGVLAVARSHPCLLSELPLHPQGLWVVLEGIEKPGNVGAIYRTADAAGASGVILADPLTDLHNHNLIRASLGSVFALPSAVATTQETIEWLRRSDISPLVTRVDATTSYYHANLASNCALVFGNESAGISDAWKQPDLEGIYLPMHGRVDSLNIANTAAIVLYEAVRQRASSHNG